MSTYNQPEYSSRSNIFCTTYRVFSQFTIKTIRRMTSLSTSKWVCLASVVLLTAPLHTQANNIDAVLVMYNVTKYVPGYTGTPIVLETSTLAYEDQTTASNALANLTACGSAQQISNVCNTQHSPCDVNADCTSISSSLVQCRCRGGFNDSASTASFLPRGIVPTGTSCPDINECQGGPCHQLADCTNTPGSFVCTCRSGFTGDGITTCNDIDECLLNTTCDVNANCTNMNGSFSCVCKTGFSGNGLTCTDIDECALPNQCTASHHTCTNTPGGFTCGCPSGMVDTGSTCATTTTAAPTTTSSFANPFTASWLWTLSILFLALTLL